MVIKEIRAAVIASLLRAFLSVRELTSI